MANTPMQVNFRPQFIKPMIIPWVITDPLSISGPKITLDPFIIQIQKNYARDSQSSSSSTQQPSSPSTNPYDGKAKEAIDSFQKQGITEDIFKVTTRIEKTGLDDATRLLLSTRNVYGYLLLKALNLPIKSGASQKVGIPPKDTTGIFNFVLRNSQDRKETFYKDVLEAVLNYKNINLQPPKLGRLLELTKERALPLRQSKLVPTISQLLNELNRESNIPAYVDKYSEKGEIRPEYFTPAIKQGMIDYLLKLGVNFTVPVANLGSEYDELFAIAYDRALRRAGAAEDPIDTVRTKGAETAWDFTVDTFESFEEQGVIPQNILAAGALDYVLYIGEILHVYDVADALVLRWANGSLDVPEGSSAALLYRYYQLRRERTTPEERGMLYRRVLDKGDAEILSGTVVNQAFPALWGQLMAEVAEYIRKSEESDSSGNISRAPIYQAVKELQYNLTEFMTGMAHLQVTEMYAHLQEAIEILSAEDIVDHFGGYRKTMWRVLERVAKEDLRFALNVSPIRTLAVEGNKVFQYIANFNQETDREEAFRYFLSAAEAWIIAQAMVESTEEMPAEEEEEEFFEEDEFSDWED